MKKTLSKSHLLKTKLAYLILDILFKNGGSFLFKRIKDEISNAPNLNKWDFDALDNGISRLESYLNIISSDLVRAGLIIKNKGLWSITKLGIQSLNENSIQIKPSRGKPYTIYKKELESKVIFEDSSNKELLFREPIAHNVSDWAKALSGNYSGIDTITAKKAHVLRKILKENDDALTKKYSRFNQASFLRTKNTLISSGLLQKKSKNKVLAYINDKIIYIKTLTTLVVGIMLGLTPILQDTVRSNSESLYTNAVSYLKSHSSTEVISKEIILEKNEPISESRLITESAISMGMTVIRSEKIEGKEKIQILIIKGFKKFDDKQAEYLKPKLNLEGRDEGNIKLIIRKNKH